MAVEKKQRKKAPETSELIEKNGFSTALIDNVNEGVFAFDKDHRYTAWSKAMEKFSGYKARQVLGKDAFEVFPYLKETGEDRYFTKALKGKTVDVKNR